MQSMDVKAEQAGIVPRLQWLSGQQSDCWVYQLLWRPDKEW